MVIDPLGRQFLGCTQCAPYGFGTYIDQVLGRELASQQGRFILQKPACQLLHGQTDDRSPQHGATLTDIADLSCPADVGKPGEQLFELAAVDDADFDRVFQIENGVTQIIRSSIR